MDATDRAMIRPDASSGTILQIITGLGVGGAERVVLELSKKLDQQAWRVVIVSLKSDRRLLQQYKEMTLPVYTLGLNRNPWSALKATLSLIKIVKRESPRIIHAHMFHALLFALACKVVKPNARLVFTSHNFAGFRHLRSWIIRMTTYFRSADIIFAEGQHPHLNASHTHIIPNGVDIDEQDYVPETDSKKKYVFLFVGRLHEQKNPIALLTAFGNIRQRNCNLWLAGDGPLRPKVQQLIGEWNLADRVKLLGVKTNVTELMLQADCFVMSSHWEGLPMVLLEAGAVGLPVIAPPVGAVPQLLGEGCGYVTQVSTLAQTMDAVMCAPQEARACGMKLRDRIVADYSADVMSKKHINLYQALLE